jgi:hypothetical protein
MATCPICEQEMAAGVACIEQRDESGDEVLVSASYDPELQGPGDTCHDCGTPSGEPHHGGCEWSGWVPEHPPETPPLPTGASRQDLIALVQHILDRPEASDQQLDVWLDQLKRHLPHPAPSDLIFWPSRNGLGKDPTAEEIVDKALSYKPIAL